MIDSHAHLGNFPLFNVGIDADQMTRQMDEYSIELSVVSSLPNSLTWEAVKKYPRRFVGLSWVDPKRAQAAEDVKKAVREWDFRGVKMHPLIDSFLPDDELINPVMETARKLQLPILFHSGHPPWSLPWHFGNLADRFPDVKIILGHMGHGHIVYINGSIEMALKHENIYLETSGMPMHAKVKEAVQKVGMDRVLYGSDMPFGHPAFELAKIRIAGLTEEELNKVFDSNARRLFKLPG